MSKKEQNFDNQIPKILVTTSNNQSTSKGNAADRKTQQETFQSKTSTPSLGRKTVSFFETNISHISTSQPSTSSGNNSMSKAASLSSLYDNSKQGACKVKLAAPAAAQKKKQKSNIDRQRKLEDLKTKYVQMYALCEMQENQNKKEKSQLEKILEQLQNRIAEDRHVLEKTRQQIQQVKINSEIETIHRLHATVFQQVLDKLEASNCDVSLKETCDLLEHYEDKVPVKDIEISEHGLEQLEKNMKNVIESVKALSSKHNFEVYNQLGKVNVNLKKCEDVAKGCKEKLAEVEQLNLQETSLKISYGDDV